MLTVRSENTVITSFQLISERQDFSSVRTAENTVRARARIHRDFNAESVKRLSEQGLSQRAIAEKLGVPRRLVKTYLMSC